MNIKFKLISKVSLLTIALLTGITLSAKVTPNAHASATASITVDTTSDVIANDGQCSLREAITAANTDTASGALPGECPAGSGADTITLATDATYTLAISGEFEDNNATGDLDIRDSLTIDGNGSTIDADTLDRALEIVATSATPVVAFNNLTIRDGRARRWGGGGIRCGDGTLTLNSSTVTSNGAYPQSSTSYDGGGIYATSCNVTLNNSSVSGNWAAGNSWSGSSGGRGGGVAVYGGSLSLNSSTVGGNSTGNGDWDGGGGGGIYFESGSGVRTLTLDQSVVKNNHTGSGTNHCSGPGGGIWARNDTVLVVTDSIIQNNYIGAGSCGSSGGGVYYVGSQTIALTGSTVNDNSANDQAGGLYIHTTATWTISNTTISSNVVTDTWNADGGGISAQQGTGTIENSTIADNVAYRYGGGMYINTTWSTVYVKNTLLADNAAAGPSAQGPDCHGALTSQRYNLIEDTSNCTISGDTTGNITGQDPQIQPLFNNGGPSAGSGETPQTHALLPDSPAIDTGDPADCPTNDQRGESRPVDYDNDSTATGDIGAFELQADETVSFSDLEEDSLYSYGITLVKIKRNIGSGDPGTVTVTKHNQPPGGAPPGTGELPVHWQITATGSSYNLDLTLCYTDGELGPLDETGLVLYRWDGSGWVSQGGTPAPGDNCVTLSNVTALSSWTLGTSQPNPVKLHGLATRPATVTASFALLIALLAIGGSRLVLIQRPRR